MVRNVPECSGMFHVPDFIDAQVLCIVVLLNVTRRNRLRESLCYKRIGSCF